MAEYYLMSQLPSLDGLGEDKPLPISEEQFLDLCSRFLGEKAQEEIKKLSITPPKNDIPSGSPLIQAWNEGERNLRLALGKVRADKMKKPFDFGNKTFSVELMKVVNTAAEMDNPLKAEQALSLYRLNFLETLRPLDTFSEDFVYYYGLKLKLMLYIRQFHTDAGETAYKNIYHSILHGDRLEDHDDRK